MSHAVYGALLAMVVMSCGVHRVSAATFYVSSVSGNDSFTGTSPDTPWLTLARVAAAPLPPGSIVLLSRNATWYGESLTLVGVSHVTIGAYGAPTARRPTIQLATSTVGQGAAVALLDAGDNITVADLEIGGGSPGVAVAPGAGGANGVTIERCFFHDIRHAYARFRIASPGWTAAIQLLGPYATANVNIRNNFGIRLDTFFSSTSTTTTLILDSNTVSKCGGNCVALTRGSDLHVFNSVFARDTPDEFFLYGTTDIILGWVCVQCWCCCCRRCGGGRRRCCCYYCCCRCC